MSENYWNGVPPNSRNITDLYPNTTDGNVIVDNEVTLNCIVDQDEYKQRKFNEENIAGQSYPGWSKDNAVITPMEMVYSYRGPRGSVSSHYSSLDTNAYSYVFSKMNGANFGNSPDQLADSVYPVGMSKNRFDMFHVGTPGTAIAVVHSGKTTMFYPTLKGTRIGYPGEEVVYTAIPTNGNNKFNRPKGQPRDAIYFPFKPFDRFDIKYRFAILFNKMTKQEVDGGISDISPEHFDKGKVKYLDSSTEASFNLRNHDLMTTLLGLRVLQRRNIVQIITPEEKQKRDIKDDLLLTLLDEFAGTDFSQNADSEIPTFEKIDTQAPGFDWTAGQGPNIKKLINAYHDVTETNIMEGRVDKYFDHKTGRETGELTENYLFFKEGFDILQKNPQSMLSTIKSKNKEKDRAFLYLYGLLTKTQFFQHLLVNDIIHGIYFGNSRVSHRDTYNPGVSESSSTKHFNNATNLYPQNLEKDAVKHTESFLVAIGEMERKMNARKIGTLTSIAKPGFGSKADIALKTYRC